MGKVKDYYTVIHYQDLQMVLIYFIKIEGMFFVVMTFDGKVAQIILQKKIFICILICNA